METFAEQPDCGPPLSGGDGQNSVSNLTGPMAPRVMGASSAMSFVWSRWRRRRSASARSGSPQDVVDLFRVDREVVQFFLGADSLAVVEGTVVLRRVAVDGFLEVLAAVGERPEVPVVLVFVRAHRPDRRVGIVGSGPRHLRVDRLAFVVGIVSEQRPEQPAVEGRLRWGAGVLQDRRQHVNVADEGVLAEPPDRLTPVVGTRR